MNALDVVIIVVLVIGVLLGFRQGFILQVAALGGAILGLIVAKLGYKVVKDLLVLVIPHSRWLTAISYVIVFAIVWAAAIIVGRNLRLVARLLFLGGIDRLAGAVLGLVQGAMLAELLLYLGKRVEGKQLHALYHHSKLAPPFLHVIPYVDKLFPHVTR